LVAIFSSKLRIESATTGGDVSVTSFSLFTINMVIIAMPNMEKMMGDSLRKFIGNILMKIGIKAKRREHCLLFRVLRIIGLVRKGICTL